MTDRPTSVLLRQTQAALAASQADLTRVAAERDEAREALTTAETTLASVRAELAETQEQLAVAVELAARARAALARLGATNSPPLPAGSRKDNE